MSFNNNSSINYHLYLVFCHSTASNSNRSTPACSPVLRKRSRSPTPQSLEGENMVEKSSDHSSDKSPSTPEQAVQRTYSQSLHTTRPTGKNSKVHTCCMVWLATVISKFFVLRVNSILNLNSIFELSCTHVYGS